ncbi:MAG: hypothetical protein FKY71_07225 [Spiribacter salinus]|uniref:Uncharacterized protein n=1 Tax=Spiribacter salinus TaxID=1335746 RepID=A0A540VSE7_9GAMM|nr:MAG: hypothetical protein FKY71_07225 [Spiribacter salinus]
MDNVNEGHERRSTKARQRRWDSLVTGLILVWLGVVVFADLGWSVGLLGVGVVVLLEQALRWHWSAACEGFYVGAGAIVVFAGGAGAAGVDVPIGAIVLIVVGLWLGGTALVHNKRD